MRWKEINEFEKYQVSETGQVKSLHRGKDITLKPEVDKDGYHIYDLSTNGQKQRKKLIDLWQRLFSPTLINFQL